MSGPDATPVTILGEEYRIRGASPDRVRELAKFVDERFRELQAARPAMDLKRLAVMACMNIAEELVRERDLRGKLDGRILEGMRRCRLTMEDALTASEEA